MTIGRIALLVATLLAEALTLSGQPKPKAPPRFEDFPVTAVFEGMPTAPKLVRGWQRQYRTRIREGVEKGWGVDRAGVERPGPNFAGDMIVIRWGCGAPCLMAAMVNARTGEIYNPPLAVNNTFGLPLLSVGCCSASRNPELEFRQDSRLMVISASPNWFKEHDQSYRHYFFWQQKHWLLVYRESLD
jgi:hypothetical protein